MSFIAVAIGGSALISGGLGYLSGENAADASAAGAEAAANATIESTQMQVDELQRQFDYQSQILGPQIQQQYYAQGAYSDLLGINQYGGSYNSEDWAGPQFPNSPMNFNRGQWGQFMDPNLDPTRMFDVSRYSDQVRGNLLAGTSAENDPYRQYIANNSLMGARGGDLLANGAAGTGVYGESFEESAGYGFQREEMERQLERANSKGGNFGGRAIMEAQRRAQGLADSEYYKWAGGRERDLQRLGSAEAADSRRLDYFSQFDVSRGDSAYLNYFSRREGDAARLDSAAMYDDRLMSADLQRSDQGYYNYLNALQSQAGFGGGPAANAVNTSMNFGSSMSNAYGSQGYGLSNIYQQSGTNQANLAYAQGANLNNSIQSGFQNYLTYAA